jgi:hypothetical protein
MHIPSGLPICLNASDKPARCGKRFVIGLYCRYQGGCCRVLGPFGSHLDLFAVGLAPFERWHVQRQRKSCAIAAYAAPTQLRRTSIRPPGPGRGERNKRTVRRIVLLEWISKPAVEMAPCAIVLEAPGVRAGARTSEGNRPTYGVLGRREPLAPPELVPLGKRPARRSGSCRIHGEKRG